MRGDLASKVGGSLSPGGPLARAMRGYEARPGQLRMALAWAEALETPRVLVAEAATGIGKTLAYLVPAILSGRKTIVSTGTRTLQQQLMENDIPLVRDILQYPFSCAVLKGRGNYLCQRRWKRFRSEPLFEFAREAGYFPAMQTFAENTRTGDVSECIGVPEDARVWGEVNARSEMCDPSACGDTERCHLAAARRRAADADLVVVNHHLFFADLALRVRLGPARGGEEGRFGEVLPRADAVVFDEAHGVEETASVFFGVTVSLGRARELARDVKRSAARAGRAWDGLLPMAERFRLVAESAFDAVGDGDARFPLPAPSAGTPFGEKSAALLRAGEELALSLSDGAPRGESPTDAPGADPGPDRDPLLRRVRSFLDDLGSVLSSDSVSAVAWAERRGISVSLHRTPVEVSPVLSGTLWVEPVPFLLTSATLSVSGDLSYFRERVGLARVEARELIVDNEFDFAGRALFYVPRGLPDPADPAFPLAAAEETREILSCSGGGALLLCTSYRTLSAMTDALRGTLPYTLYVQGDAPRAHLLRAFREGEDTVLIGTGTFWEGVDIPGASLRCVVIDKLPFASPSDPVTSARIRALRDRGEDPFHSYQLPEAILSLRQGVGRLLRRGDDYGVVALLDRRVSTRGYGELFRANLPPARWTDDRAEVAAFFRRFRGGPESEDKEETE
ncbi:MAG TPA: ATP-dependent DNA helicase [Candidatus Methylomirabilis sp.]|nr:ATP-dependent DNA helicase [Candidatus Methylomirabilis sp.]